MTIYKTRVIYYVSRFSFTFKCHQMSIKYVFTHQLKYTLCPDQLIYYGRIMESNGFQTAPSLVIATTRGLFVNVKAIMQRWAVKVTKILNSNYITICNLW